MMMFQGRLTQLSDRETATILNRSVSFLDGPFYSPSNWQIEGAPRAFAVR